jgi:ENTS family enterobactin (siderophore) exporter
VVAGPALGGLLVSALGVETVIAFVAAGFATSAALAARTVLRRPGGAEAPGAQEGLPTGVRHARSLGPLRGFFVVTGVLLLATAGRWSHPFLFVLDAPGGGQQAAGLLAAAGGFGFVLGAAAAPAAARRWPREGLVPLGLVAGAAALLGAAPGAAPAARAGLWILAGACAGLVAICYESLLQERTPDLVRGRALGVARAVLHAGLLGGVALEAWIAGVVGVGALAASAGLLVVAAAASVVVMSVPGTAPSPARAVAPGAP